MLAVGKKLILRLIVIMNSPIMNRFTIYQTKEWLFHLFIYFFKIGTLLRLRDSVGPDYLRRRTLDTRRGIKMTDKSFGIYSQSVVFPTFKGKHELKSHIVWKLCHTKNKYCGNTTNVRNSVARWVGRKDQEKSPTAPNQTTITTTLSKAAKTAGKSELQSTLNVYF